MSLIRFVMMGAIPNTPTNREQLETNRPALRQLKTKCVVINEDLPNEETITRFTYHICHHDTGERCEEENEI